MGIVVSAYERTFFVLKRVLALAEFFLLLRLALMFGGASPASFVVWHLYTATDYLVWPFRGIFPDYVWLERTIDTSTAAAMVGYVLAFFIVFRVLRLFQKGPDF